MVVKLRMFILLLVFAAASSFAQNISISASTDTSQYKVGDYIKYTLDIKHDKNIHVIMPSVKDSIKNLDFIEALKPKTNEVNNNVIEQHTFIFSKYDSAQVTIPSYKIFYTTGSDPTKKFLEVNPVTVVVKTLPINKKADIRDVKEPLTLPLNWLLIAIIAFVVLALLVGGYYLYKYFKKKNQGAVETKPEIVIPPDEIALHALFELEEKKLWQQGLIKDYHSEVTGIVRKYFEGRFDFRALELTSSEILGCLSYIEEGQKIIKTAEDFFSNADLVKFAKFQPMPSVNEEMMKEAFDIVKQTRTVSKPVENNEVEKEEENVQ